MRRRVVISAFLTVAVGLVGWIAVDARFPLFSETQMLPTNALSTLRALYAVNQASAMRGSISVYDIDRGHRLVKTISTVPNVDDVRGVAVSAVTGKLYVSYRTHSGVGMIYCLSVYQDVVLWNRAIKPDVDSLTTTKKGFFFYVQTGGAGSAHNINFLDKNRGKVFRKIIFST